MVGLTQDQKKFWDENGYVILDGIFTNEEVDEMRDAYDDIFARKQKDSDLETQWEGKRKYTTEYGSGAEKKLVLAVHNLQFHHASFSKALMNDKFTAAAADCVGSPNLLLHHTKAHLKPPREGSAYPPHQDHPYFPYKNRSLVAAVIHLEDSGPEIGGLYVYPGSHKLGYLPSVSDVPGVHHLDPAQFPIETALPVVARKGQVLIFHCLTIHASAPNKSDKPRRLYLIEMMAAEDEPEKEVHRSYGRGWVLRGYNLKRDANMMTSRFIEGSG